MEIFDQNEGIKIIVNSIRDNRIVPIIGAGFTAGCDACDGKVFNGRTMQDEMIKCIKMYSKTYSGSNIEIFPFKKLSEIFFDEEEVPSSISLKILKDHFTEVTLPQYKINFLNCWRYIYTINIDDAIENAGFSPVTSYTNLRNESINIVKKNNYVLKLHGDAKHEILYKIDNNIVFSSDQYISSLLQKSNAQIINSIRSDYKQKNILFIGCSLEDEPDLKYIYDDTKNDISKTSYILQVRRNEPDKIDLKNITRHGVNSIIIVENYDAFYKEVYNEFNRHKNITIASEYKYKNPKTDILKDKKNILRDISRGRNPFDEKEGLFKIPSTCIERTVTTLNILREIDSNHFFIIQGSRFSGKTYIINDIIQHTPMYDKYFFPSNISFDESIVEGILNNTENSLLIFDSNSITPEIYKILLEKKELILQRKNKIFVASNTNEDFLISKLKAKHYYINRYFDSNELDIFNEKANKLAFLQRKDIYSNLEYSYLLLQQNNMDMKCVPRNISEFTQNEQTIIFMLCVFDKVYLHEALSMGILRTELKTFVQQYPILFEMIDCDPEEAHGKSVEKIIHNSKSILLHLIKKMPQSNVLASIKKVIVNLYNYDKEQYKSVMMFDTLNQLFGQQDGAGYLIEYIYEGLEEELYNEQHFWLQRAKSIYRLFRNNKNKLLIAATYAQKAVADSRPYSNLCLKAKFSTALIYCMLYNIEKNVQLKIEYQIKSIEILHDVLVPNDYDYIPYSVHSDIFTFRRHNESAYDNIMSICDSFITPENGKLYPIIVSYSIDIVGKLRALKNIYENQQWILANSK